jgi:hypothetical protein
MFCASWEGLRFLWSAVGSCTITQVHELTRIGAKFLQSHESRPYLQYNRVDEHLSWRSMSEVDLRDLPLTSSRSASKLRG